MRLVLDTNVVASALLWDGPPRLLLRTGPHENIVLLSSAPLLAELTDILSRPKFEQKIAASLLSVDQLVDLYAELVSLVRPALVPRIAPKADGPHQFAANKGARNKVLVARGGQAVTQHIHRSLAMFLGGFAEGAGLTFESLETQPPERLGILRPEGPNFYSHI